LKVEEDMEVQDISNNNDENDEEEYKESNEDFERQDDDLEQ
jgi:hypothetical protein